MASTTLITNIKELVGLHPTDAVLRGQQLASLPMLHKAYLVIENHEIAEVGSMETIDRNRFSGTHQIDATGKFVLPGWCDSHTHLVFAASREEEFVDKIKGRSYEEIAAKGGGILNSARKVAEASEEVLFAAAYSRLQQISKSGTTTVEIKSGYGLSVEAELKMLRVIKKLKERSSLQIKATFNFSSAQVKRRSSARPNSKGSMERRSILSQETTSAQPASYTAVVRAPKPYNSPLNDRRSIEAPEARQDSCRSSE